MEDGDLTRAIERFRPVATVLNLHTSESRTLAGGGSSSDGIMSLTYGDASYDFLRDGSLSSCIVSEPLSQRPAQPIADSYFRKNSMSTIWLETRGTCARPNCILFRSQDRGPTQETGCLYWTWRDLDHMPLTRRLGNRIRHWQRDNRLNAEDAARKLGMTLERYVQISSLGRPTPEEVDRVVAVTGIDREWLEGWANRPPRTTQVVPPRN
jgi:hypothetical protein